jgi:Na+-transporting NADH:ubiquinone oxidoreductase subunit NqrB
MAWHFLQFFGVLIEFLLFCYLVNIFIICGVSVSIETVDWTTSISVLTGAGKGFSLFDAMSRPAVDSTQSPIHQVPGAFSLGIKYPECEADNSPPSGAKVKHAWSYNSTPPW